MTRILSIYFFSSICKVDVRQSHSVDNYPLLRKRCLISKQAEKMHHDDDVYHYIGERLKLEKEMEWRGI